MHHAPQGHSRGQHHGAALVGLSAAETVQELDHIIRLQVHVPVKSPHAVARLVFVVAPLVLTDRQPPYSGGRKRAVARSRTATAAFLHQRVEAAEGLDHEAVLRHEGHVLQHEARVPLRDVLHLCLDQHLLVCVRCVEDGIEWVTMTLWC